MDSLDQLLLGDYIHRLHRCVAYIGHLPQSHYEFMCRSLTYEELDAGFSLERPMPYETRINIAQKYNNLIQAADEILQSAVHNGAESINAIADQYVNIKEALLLEIATFDKTFSSRLSHIYFSSASQPSIISFDPPRIKSKFILDGLSPTGGSKLVR